ncbi:MAG: penicillin acylase family protein [Proteobacteria bacterium]|nr:penicillin acylase family protein [Pseudomonadota bacterium]
MRVRRWFAVSLSAAAVAVLGFMCPNPQGPPPTALSLEGLEAPVKVITDRFGVRHLFAESDLDLVRVQGYVHARDRLWQMDLTRREVDGTRAELLGIGEIAGDIQIRVIGLARAASRTEAELTDDERLVLQTYADGVNAYIAEAEAAGTLPPEYAEIYVTQVRPWEVVDTLAIGKGIAASLSLDLDTGLTEALAAYVAAGEAQGFDGQALFSQDVNRSAPMSPAATQPDADDTRPYVDGPSPLASGESARLERAARLAAEFRERAAKAPLLAAVMARREFEIGSNHWGVTADASDNGNPMIANDPHLSLGWPSTFYENHLVVSDDPIEGPLNVSGVTFPGVPYVILGQNERVAWGATTNPMDVSDVFEDTFYAGSSPNCTGGPCIVSAGESHPVEATTASYRFNPLDPSQPDTTVVFDQPITAPGALILTVPFRSFGPVIGLDDPGVILGTSESATGLVLQYTGFHATQEVRTFRLWNRARNLDQFLDGLQFFDAGSQNWAYADADGNLGYFASAEMPLRADLEQGTVFENRPPFVVRPGSGEANWVPDPARSQGQTIPFQILPFAEMPQSLNPSNGFFANANNDPAGTSLDNDPLNQRRLSNPNAIYYLSPGYAIGLRAGRITQLLRDALDAEGRVSLDFLRKMQGNTQQLDAELMVPFLVAAYDAAEASPDLAEILSAQPAIGEAVERLRTWDFSTPTGVPEGYDAHDHQGERIGLISGAEAEASVAATLYNVWRGLLVRRVIDARLAGLGVPGVGSGEALKGLFHLLSQTPFTGVGASGIDFFPEPAADGAADRRDRVLLETMGEALDALAGDTYAAAFGNSTNLDDYRWGRLHRKTFGHELGGSFSAPPAAGLEDLGPGLPGAARDGGYQVVNASGFSARAAGLNSFRFGGGPVRRYAGAAGASVDPELRVVGYNAIPGGSNSRQGDPTFATQLGPWLTADQHPVEMRAPEALRAAISVEDFSAP